MATTGQGVGLSALLTIALIAQSILNICMSSQAQAIGLASPMRFPMRTHLVTSRKTQNKPKVTRIHGRAVMRHSGKSRLALKQKKRAGKAAPKVPVPLPQNLIGLLSTRTIAPGVVYKSYRGGPSVNVLDADLVNAPVVVRPVIAGSSFRLAEVKSHAQQTNAIAAVNANYFKKDGTPLGTLIINKEWVAGPLYDRVSLGITRCGFVRIDCVNLNGLLTTNNPKASTLWVNNINQPRRSGCHIFAYTRRWGTQVRLPYAGTLIAVDNCGKIVDKKTTVIDIPPGGFVLSDAKSARISKLNVGEQASLMWRATPDSWHDVVEAVSGGPMLLKDGQLYLDLGRENFKKAWTSSSIKARTAAGVTADNHLLLVTVEGPHTLWDMAKLLQKLGAIDAMNLDGGGSTTMVVGGKTVTRNANSFQRRVASALTLVSSSKAGGSDLPASSVHRLSPNDVDQPVVIHEQPVLNSLTDPATSAQPDQPAATTAQPASPEAVGPSNSDTVRTAADPQLDTQAQSGHRRYKYVIGIRKQVCAS